ncbi:MAG: YHS domain-containing protein [bacterium]
MRTRVFLTMVIGLALSLATVSLAGEKTEPASDTAAPPVLKNQTVCPVMGGAIDSTVYTDIQGQRVYHCCPMCSAKLKADPDKYFKQAAAEGVLFENIQTTCPVSGEKLEEKSTFSDYEGRRIYFCCEMCPPKFAADPAKYLGNLEPVTKPEKSEAADTSAKEASIEEHGHSGHNH